MGGSTKSTTTTENKIPEWMSANGQAITKQAMAMPPL